VRGLPALWPALCITYHGADGVLTGLYRAFPDAAAVTPQNHWYAEEARPGTAYCSEY